VFFVLFVAKYLCRFFLNLMNSTLETIDIAFPATLREALTLQSSEQTRGRLLAGGTDLMAQWESGVLPIPVRAISLQSINELRGISEVNYSPNMEPGRPRPGPSPHLSIGALTTHAELRSSPLVQKHLTSLAAAAATVGSAQIQGRGTLAGNVANASPAGDLIPSLLIANAVVVVASVNGEREIPLASFFLGYRKIDLHPDEIIARFVLKKCPEGSHEGFRKLGPRAAQAISKIMGAYRARVEKGVVQCFHLALGSVAPTPIRLFDFEGWIKGKTLSSGLLDEAEQKVVSLISPIADLRSTAEYRQWVAGRIVRGFLEELMGG
jgi:CO/xanthine dehydrogenase FAD-binding subunit